MPGSWASACACLARSALRPRAIAAIGSRRRMRRQCAPIRHSCGRKRGGRRRAMTSRSRSRIRLARLGLRLKASLFLHHRFPITSGSSVRNCSDQTSQLSPSNTGLPPTCTCARAKSKVIVPPRGSRTNAIRGLPRESRALRSRDSRAPIRQSCSSFWNAIAMLPPPWSRRTSLPAVGSTHQCMRAAGISADASPWQLASAVVVLAGQLGCVGSSWCGPADLLEVERPPSPAIRSAASSGVRGRSSSSPEGTRTTRSIPSCVKSKKRWCRYLKSQLFARPGGTNVFASSPVPRKVTSVPLPFCGCSPRTCRWQPGQ